MDITKISNHGVKNTNTKKLGKAGDGGKFSVDESAGVHKSVAPAEIKFSSIDALFLNLDNRRKNQRQAVEKGGQILEQLDDLRLNIITGTVPKKTLENISSLLKIHIETITDERLRNILLEVETRAKVELAKLEKIDE